MQTGSHRSGDAHRDRDGASGAGSARLVPAFTIWLELDRTGRRTPGMLSVSGLKFAQLAISGGRFQGARIRGTVLPGGRDSGYSRQDGIAALNATYVLRADDGTLIHFRNRGIRGNAPVAGTPGWDPGGEGSIYFRTAPTIDVPPGPHAWLTEHIFIGSGLRTATGNQIDYYMLETDADSVPES